MIFNARSWLPLLLCAAACSSYPPRRIYLLTPPIDPPVAAMSTPPRAGDSMAPTQRLDVRRIVVPDYLDSTDIVMRSGSDEVKTSLTGRWGERLSLGVTRAIRADLAAGMPQYSIVQDDSSEGRRLLITINALDLWENGRCSLSANWSIVDQGSSIPMTSGSGSFEILNADGTPTLTDAMRVEAVARTLSKLAAAVIPGARTSLESARPAAQVLATE